MPAAFTPSAPRIDAGVRSATQGPKKVTVCTTYFQNASCASGAQCGFAHHLQELDGSVQAKLLGLMGEQLPGHFLAPPVVVAVDAATEEQRAFNAFFNIQQKRQTHPTGGGGHLSSSASSSSSSQDSPTLAADPVPAVPLRRISIGLPPRCQYPHPVPGTLYDFMNVKRKCRTEDVEEAYRRWRTTGYKAAKGIDPAKADAMDRLIVDAKNVLGNPSIRAEYDSLLPENPTSLSQQQGLCQQQQQHNTARSSSSTTPPAPKLADKSIATPAVAPMFEGSIW